MSFFGAIGKIFHSSGAQVATQIGTSLVETAANGLNPGFGALVLMIGNAILAAEVKAPSAPGADKKEEVKSIIDTTTPLTLSVISSLTGKQVTDPTTVAPALDALIDDLVAFFNQIGLLKHSSSTQSPA